MNRVIKVAVLAFLTGAVALPAWAEEPNGRDAEIKELKARLEKLEQAGAQKPEGGLLSKVEVSGFVTLIGQGTVGNDPGDKTGANVSADLVLSVKPSEASTIGLHLDMARGTGISNTPGTGFAIGRFDGCHLGGPNADLEWNSDIPHLVEAWYEHALLDETLVLTFGIMDPTVYFDTNNFANDERLQFLADTFVNNPGIDWGGDANGYGPGARLTVSPVEWLDVSLGGFATHTVSPLEGDEQDEVVGFENEFDQPFGILEVDLKLAPLDREGNYRLYLWYNANEDNFADFATGQPKASWGGGGSFDQMLTDNLGAFLRWSKQDDSIRELEWTLSGGLAATGAVPARPSDVAAIGYAVGWVSDKFQGEPDCLGTESTEQWLEAYYSFCVTPYFFLTPDLQYVINPGGEDDSIFIWGLRANAVF